MILIIIFASLFLMITFRDLLWKFGPTKVLYSCLEESRHLENHQNFDGFHSVYLFLIKVFNGIRHHIRIEYLLLRSSTSVESSNFQRSLRFDSVQLEIK